MNPRTRFFRNIAMLSVLGAGLAACGEDTIVFPDPLPTISASPAQMNLVVGQTQAIIPTITGLSNIAVTYTSTNTGVATVTAAGVVTAVAPGAATIRVVSQAQPTLETGVGVNVTASTGGPVNPDTVPRVTLQSITQAGTIFPVDPNNVNGIIDVTFAVNRAPSSTGFQVFVGNREIPQCRQTFTPQAAAFAGEAEVAAQAGAVSVVCTIDTTADSAGVANFLNAVQTVQGRLMRGTVVQASATSGQLRFQNMNFVRIVLTTPTSVISADNNLRWNGGDVTARAIPVVFDGAPVGRAVFTYVVPGNHAEFGGSVVTKEVTAATAGAFVATFPAGATNTPAASGANRGVARVTDPGFQVFVQTIRTDGQEGPGDTSNNWLDRVRFNDQCCRNVVAFRYDAEFPNPGVLTLPVFNAGSTQISQIDGWVNAAYLFSRGHGQSAATGGAGTAPSDDRSTIPGVGGITITYHAAPNTGFTNPNALTATERATVIATPAITTPTGLAESINSQAYVVVARVRDQLGNETTIQLIRQDGAGTIGVDKIAPVIIIVPGTPADKATNPTANYTFAISDSSVAFVPSGFGPAPLFRRVPLYRPDLARTSAASCPIGSHSAITGNCSFQSSNTTSFPLPAGEGYDTIQVFARDKAGNATQTITLAALRDNTAPAVSNISTPPVLTGGQAANFSAIATDNLDLARGHFFQGFAGLWLQFEPTKTLGTWGLPFELTSNLTTSAPFIRGVQQVTAGGVPTGSFTNANGSRWIVFDMTVTDPNAVPFGLRADVQDAFTFNRPAGAATTFSTNWTTIVDNSNPVVCSPTDGLTACSSTPTSTTIGLRVVGPGTFDRPFERIVLLQDIGGGSWSAVGQSTSVAVTDVAGTRTWTYTGVSWNPGSNAAAGAQTFRIAGIDANGDALLSNPTTVTVVRGGP
jgi:hypothetical protein